MTEKVSSMKQQFEQSQYKDLCPVGESGHVLVMNELTGQIGLKKVLSYFSLPVFEYLRSHRNIHIPRVYSYWKENGKLTVIEEYIQGRTLEEMLKESAPEDGSDTWEDAEQKQSYDPSAHHRLPGNRSSSDRLLDDRSSDSRLSDNRLSDNRSCNDGLSCDRTSYELTNEERLRILLDICDGVRFLHEADGGPIIHRDLKASNIMITGEGVVKIIDYDAAKIHHPAEERDTVLLGTEGSAAPEQYGFGSSDARTDVYGIGMLIRELFPEDTQMLRIADKATRLDPKDRYPDVQTLQRALSGKPAVNSRVPGMFRYIPGFRSGNIRNMLIAIFGYVLLVQIALASDFQGNDGKALTGGALWLNRACLLLAGLSVIFLVTGAFPWMRRLPLLQNGHKLIRLLGCLLWSAVFVLFWVIVSSFL